MNMFTPPECEDFTYFRTVLENVFWLETLLVLEKQKFIKSTTDNKEKLALSEGREIKGNFSPHEKSGTGLPVMRVGMTVKPYDGTPIQNVQRS